MSKLKLNRRTFMALSGLGAGSLLLPSGRTFAQDTPPRLLMIYGEGGWTSRATFMRPAFAPAEWGHWSDILRISKGIGMPNTTPDNTEFEFGFTDSRLERSDMSQVLDPFWDVRSKMLAFEGLAMLSTGWDPHGDAHAKNHLAMTTAGPAISEYDGVKSIAAYPSIDQLLLTDFQRADPLAYALAFNPHLQRRSGTSGFHYPLYKANAAGAMERLAREGDPEATFARLFGGLPEMDDRRVEAQRAVFAALQQQYRDLGSRMTGRDAMRIEAHRSTLDNLAMRLAQPRVACESPSVGAVDGLDRVETYESDWNAFGDMVISAFGCGLTRIATMSLGSVPPEAYGVPAEADIHHEYEHESSPNSYYNGDGEMGGNIEAEQGMIRRNVHRAGLVAGLVRRLDEIPEGSGTMLDNTVVLFASELSHGAHGTEYCPFLVFGGGDRFGSQGRYIKYPQNNPNPWNRNYSNEHTGTPHSRLYISILQSLGLDIDYIHATSIDGSVPHANITGATQMSGPLPRL